MADIDVTNKQGVSVMGDQVVVLLPMKRMTALEALTHAAWLVTLAEIAVNGAHPLFEEVLEAVQNA